MSQPARRAILAVACAGLVAGVALRHVARAGVAAPDMVYFAGGHTRIGSDDGEPAERPVFYAEVAPFLLDVHPITVADFRGQTAAMQEGFDRAGAGLPPGTPLSSDVEVELLEKLVGS